MDEELTPEQEQARAEKVGRWIAENDRFARFLGIRLDEIRPGFCRVSVPVTADLINAVGLGHGGLTFATADFAFAAASNSHGTAAVSLAAQISYPAASKEGDVLVAVAEEVTRSKRTALYRVEVHTGEGTLVGVFTGTVFRRSDSLSGRLESD